MFLPLIFRRKLSPTTLDSRMFTLPLLLLLPALLLLPMTAVAAVAGGCSSTPGESCRIAGCPGCIPLMLLLSLPLTLGVTVAGKQLLALLTPLLLLLTLI